tara:strand:- start:8319 stop:8582 length:264 start_codon:yes stop_codon:yes gene_type:complete
MKNSLIAIGLSVAVCAAVPAFGKDKSDKAVADADKQICKTFADTGSRINKTRICKTAADWAEDRSENAKAMREKRGNQGAPQIGNDG